MVGIGYLSAVTDDDDTVEVGEPEVGYLYALAILGLYRQLASQETGTGYGRYQKEVDRWEYEVEKRRRQVRMDIPAITIKLPWWRY